MADTMYLLAARSVFRSCCCCGSLTDSARPRGRTRSTGSSTAGNSSPSAWPAAVVSADLEVPPLVRIHGVCFTGDVLGSERCDCAAQRRTPLVLPCDDVLDAVA